MGRGGGPAQAIRYLRRLAVDYFREHNADEILPGYTLADQAHDNTGLTVDGYANMMAVDREVMFF